MGENKTTTISLSWLFWMILWGCIGFLIYGTIEGAVALAIYSALTGIILWFGLIPILGVFFTYTLLNYVQEWLLNYIPMSWAVSAIFWSGVAGSTFITIVTLIATLAVIFK